MFWIQARKYIIIIYLDSENFSSPEFAQPIGFSAFVCNFCNTDFNSENLTANAGALID